MKTTVNKFDFVRAFDTADRGNNFSRPAREALFEYLEELEESSGEEMELDVIAICCDWSEYNTALEAAIEMGGYEASEGDEEEQEAEASEYLQDQTQFVAFDGGIVVQSF